VAKIRNIQCFAADGRRIRSYSPEAIERLREGGRVVVIRNRSGRVTSAHFCEIAGANPVSKTAHMGQHYSYQQSIGEARLWQHRPLISRVDRNELLDSMDHNQAENFIRGVFRAVPLSCLSAGKPKAKVVSIAEYRSGRRKAVRPLEFDSELRAA
jgi:hypothetical protein